ncbi:hypothetical protein [Chitinimonas sp.]|uniref:hypothetical protein n=1 Tax=Chitinimonas sp. TaxID=1934313 RepID=UPI002F946418
MLTKAPRTLLVLLALIFIGRLIFAWLQTGPIVFPLLQLGLFSVLAWQALRGREGAGKVLGGLQLLGGIFVLLEFASLVGHPQALILLPWAALLIGTALYLFVSLELRHFYASRSFKSI